MKKTTEVLEQEPSFSLEIKTPKNETIFTFPVDVITAVRHLINQGIKRNSVADGEIFSESAVKTHENFPKSLSMVSALRGEGVTYTSWALAAALVHDFSAKVCIVDLNWWNPFKSPISSNQNLGVAGILSQKIGLGEGIVKTNFQNLSYLPAGALQRHERSIYARSQEMKKLIFDLHKNYDHLILDIPAILANPDAVPLAQLGKSCCLVIRQGVTRVEDVQHALDEIDHLHVLGSVLNQVKYASPSWLQNFLHTA